MSVAPPDAHTLRLYLDGELPADEAQEVRSWLILAATPEVMAVVEHVAGDVETRRARLAYWARNPVRARLARLAWRVRSRAGSILNVEQGDRTPLLGTLGGSATPEPAGDLRTVAVVPGQAVRLVVTLDAASWVGVFAVTPDDRVQVMSPGDVAQPAGVPVDIGGVSMDPDDGAVDIYVVIDESGPLPTLVEEADGRSLAALLGSAGAAGSRRSVLTCTLHVQADQPSGKQT